MPIVKKKLDANNFQLKDQVVSINRVTKVVKGGKNMSFAALVVVGDPSAAVVGYGSGKAKEVQQVLLGRFDALEDRLRNFLRHARTISHNRGGWITHHYQRCERHVLAALHNLGDAVDRNHLVLQLVLIGVKLLLYYWHSRNFSRLSRAARLN